MRKRKFSIFVTPMLILGLAACNNDTNDAMDNQNNTVNTANRGGTNVAQVNNKNREVDDRTAYGFDHRGPLTEDYLDNDNRNNGRNVTRVNNNNNNRNATNVNWSRNNNANWGNGTTNWSLRNINDANDANWTGQNNRDNNNGVNRNKTARNKNYDNTDDNPNLSALNTSLSSNNYPHTRAVLIQEGRYQFIPANPDLDNELQARLRQSKELAQLIPQQPNQAPVQQQTPAQQPAPAQQQTPAQQPAPAQKQTPAKQPAPAQKQTPAKQQAPANISQAAQQVIDLTNEQRKKNGLPPLQADTKLSSVAQMKSVDMQQKGYFSHTSPTYGSPFDMMRDQGVTYRTAGENIAQGQRTPQEVVNAWMNSEGHRRNILNRDFTHIGVGYESAGNHWTQMFIGK
ncbi:CAP domain-containing protein [Niallia oryzisoli]|uniref:CAP domain-containing protein n=1 Tax=Niallia oryzisoli TaxID=1737571 RepID=A0ABZ2CDA5_9BACI